jgi:pyrimidine-nucleoside phosphorylase
LVELILKKRKGGHHTREEIDYIINGYTTGTIPDYQMSAWLMAVCFTGMTPEETADLTMSMVHSGKMLDLSPLGQFIMDKHSTGGVGDKTTLILAPWVASLGVPIAKMSGRGLGHTGGTLDKLESFPGIKLSLTPDEIVHQVSKIGLVICAQNENLVPADQKIYALRDVTGTVDHPTLITSSIMSKKLACGANGILIDLKVGEGAFIRDEQEARALANLMIETALHMDKKIEVVMTSMENPLGLAIGNILEVKEAISTLSGNGPDDLTQLCLDLGVSMVIMAGKADNETDAEHLLTESLQTGKALEKFKEWIAFQHGDTRLIDNPQLFPEASVKIPLLAWTDGYIEKINALNTGLAAVSTGAGRTTKTSPVDLTAGIKLEMGAGKMVKKGDILAWIHASTEQKANDALEKLQNAYTIGQNPATAGEIILDHIR